MQIQKKIIIQNVVQELQSVRKLIEDQKIEIKILKKQLQEMEIKLDTLERELGIFRAKEQKKVQQIGTPSPRIKHQAQLSTQWKALEYLTQASEDNKCLIASLEENIAPKASSNLGKIMQKRYYPLVSVPKLAQAQKHLQTWVVYQSRKS